ncbi:lachesin-like [Amphibalanus amphitrite]|uniref:lachesin-like n=1 Tax=Amphibalanus amphitrite TaxID=1232801 RepID=UPI001C90AE06|nr:lachesin-like [Amphibalanus amphitrite]
MALTGLLVTVLTLQLTVRPGSVSGSSWTGSSGPAGHGFNMFEGVPEPMFVGQVQNVTVSQGREVVLTCTVKHLGPYRVGWLKADTQTILSLHTRTVTTNQRISVTHDQQRGWSLHVRRAQPADGGCYMCQINTAVMKKQVGCVTVQVPPAFDNNRTSQDVNVRSGENVTLTCRAEGDPPPRISWRREDDLPILLSDTDPPVKIPVHRGAWLGLVKVSRHHDGAYYCIANNEVPPAISKRIMVNVAFAPVVRVPHQLMSAPRGSDVTLECQIESHPVPSTLWLKAGQPLRMDGKKYVMREVHSHGRKTHVALQIRDFHPSDVGQYTCVASNAISREEGYIRVHETVRVTTPPSPPPARRTPPPRRRPTPRHRPRPSTEWPEEVTWRPAVTSGRPRRPAVQLADEMTAAAGQRPAAGQAALVTLAVIVTGGKVLWAG